MVAEVGLGLEQAEAGAGPAGQQLAGDRGAEDAAADHGQVALARGRRAVTAGHRGQWASPEACAGGRDSSASEVISSCPCAASSSTSVASWAERA